MFHINDYFTRLPGSYLFAEIARRVKAYSAAHPNADIIRLGIGDVTRPLALTVEVERLDDGGVRLTTQTTIDRTDFGVGRALLGMVIDATAITTDLTFRRSGG